MKDDVRIEYGVLLPTFPVQTMVVKLVGDDCLRTFAVREKDPEKIYGGDMRRTKDLPTETETERGK